MFEEKVNAGTDTWTDRQQAMTLARWPTASGAKNHVRLAIQRPYVEDITVVI